MQHQSEMEAIRSKFEARFSQFGFALPDANTRSRTPGKISNRGWVIWFVFGEDVKGAYLDYYACHRFTDDEHVRIYWDGSVENLPAQTMWSGVSDDPDENAKLKRESYEYNRMVMESLRAKGIDLL